MASLSPRRFEDTGVYFFTIYVSSDVFVPEDSVWVIRVQDVHKVVKLRV